MPDLTCPKVNLTSRPSARPHRAHRGRFALLWPLARFDSERPGAPGRITVSGVATRLRPRARGPHAVRAPGAAHRAEAPLTTSRAAHTMERWTFGAAGLEPLSSRRPVPRRATPAARLRSL